MSGGYPQPLMFTRRTASSVKLSSGGGVGMAEDDETGIEELLLSSLSCSNVEFFVWYGAVEYMT